MSWLLIFKFNCSCQKFQIFFLAISFIVLRHKGGLGQHQQNRIVIPWRHHKIIFKALFSKTNYNKSTRNSEEGREMKILFNKTYKANQDKNVEKGFDVNEKMFFAVLWNYFQSEICGLIEWEICQKQREKNMKFFSQNLG